MEERKAKILINRAGGNAGAQSKGYRVALPSAWMKSLGITENDREVLLQFDGECITLRRPGPSGYEAFLREARRQGHELLRLHYYDGATLCTKICSREGAPLIDLYQKYEISSYTNHSHRQWINIIAFCQGVANSKGCKYGYQSCS